VKNILVEGREQVELADIGQQAERAKKILARVRKAMLAPNVVKDPPRFSPAQLGALVNLDTRQVDYRARKGGSLPAGGLNTAGTRREFQLTEVRQWTRELNHVAVIVGGYDAQTKHGGQSGAVFTPVSKARQQQAVKYLNGAILQTPEWLLKPEILSRIEPNSGSARLLSAQKSVLRNLMDRNRLGRLQEQEASLGDRSYKLGELLADVRAGVFTELSSPAPKIDAHRRNLQRAYLELLNERLNHAAPAPINFPGFRFPSPNAQDDQRGAIRAELKSLQSQFSTKLPTAKGASKAHLEDLKDQITKILDPKFAAPSSPVANPLGRTGAKGDDTCWPGIDAAFE